MLTFKEIKQEAMMVKDAKGFKAVSDYFWALAEDGESVKCGNGWEIIRDEEFNGIVMINEKYKNQIPHGLLICVVQGCTGVSHGGHFCKHGGEPTEAMVLFPGNQFNEKDYLIVRDALCDKYGGIPFKSANGESVLTRLFKEKKAVHLKELGVKVRRVSQSDNIEIELTRNGIKFTPCHEEDCYKQGIYVVDSIFACGNHKHKGRKRSGHETRRNMIKAFRIMTAQINLSITPEGEQLSIWKQMENVLFFLFRRGNKGFEVNLPNGDVITFKVTNNCHLYYLVSGNRNHNYICANYECLGVTTHTPKTNPSQLFCEQCKNRKANMDLSKIKGNAEFGCGTVKL